MWTLYFGIVFLTLWVSLINNEQESYDNINDPDWQTGSNLLQKQGVMFQFVIAFV